MLKKDVPFEWCEDHQHTFEILKESITELSLLQYYDPRKPTVLEVDASSKGLGACIVQEGKPVAFASKSLSSAEKNYSNIERETLALVFGVTRFHTYLYGTSFIVNSDHKPLEDIWKKPLHDMPPRLQRLLIKVQGYDMDVRYKPGKLMQIADALSRLPNPAKAENIELDVSINTINVNGRMIDIQTINFGQTKQQEIRYETDPTLTALSKIINTGWPASIKDLPTELRPYWSFRDDIGIAEGVLFKGKQVIIPVHLREDILQQLHQAHLGIERTRRLARETVYWPGINNEIELQTKACTKCQKYMPAQQQETTIPHEVPHLPWTKLATDLFQWKGKEHLLIVDYTSKYPIAIETTSTTSKKIASITSQIFSLFGAPRQMISDNGPQFIGEPYRNMLAKYGVKHITSSPRYPQSNGLAERFVRTVKSTLMKTNSQEEFDIALLHIRATPGEGIPSPGEIMFGRTIRTNLPSFRNHETKEYEENLQERQRKASALPGKDLLPLEPGQPVTYRQPDGSWMPAAVIADRDEPRSYDIRTPSGILRRNRIQLRDRITKAVTFAESPTESEDTTTRAHPQRNRRPPAHLADYTK
ncbi:MAG: RNase H-like domain-containing protein [Kangiellaceae bacterium]|nr:RNase H-like domain-containing protein [Kangiellaceae bacterium]